jgi:hypothetical protein
MKQFKKEFIDVVNYSIDRSKKLKDLDQGLFYVGYGNPNSEIIIFGKEHSYKEEDIEQKFDEYINNANEWKGHIESNFFQVRSTSKVLKVKTSKFKYYNNAFLPYYSNGVRFQKSGHTWTKYQKLINFYNEKENSFGGEFLFDCFISEINTIPSKTSVIKEYNESDRISFLQNDFYQNFPIKILACGKYLTDEKICQIFKLDINTKQVIMNKPRLNVFKTKDQIIINTRQLSMNVSNEYIKEIVNQINLFNQTK